MRAPDLVLPGVEVAGFEPRASSSRTVGRAVDGGCIGTSRAVGGHIETVLVGVVAVLRCCVRHEAPGGRERCPGRCRRVVALGTQRRRGTCLRTACCELCYGGRHRTRLPCRGHSTRRTRRRSFLVTVAIRLTAHRAPDLQLRRNPDNSAATAAGPAASPNIGRFTCDPGTPKVGTFSWPPAGTTTRPLTGLSSQTGERGGMGCLTWVESGPHLIPSSGILCDASTSRS